VGLTVGVDVGTAIGAAVGVRTGVVVGGATGVATGGAVGARLGTLVGAVVGAARGTARGLGDGPPTEEGGWVIVPVVAAKRAKSLAARVRGMPPPTKRKVLAECGTVMSTGVRTGSCRTALGSTEPAWAVRGRGLLCTCVWGGAERWLVRRVPWAMLIPFLSVASVCYLWMPAIAVTAVIAGIADCETSATIAMMAVSQHGKTGLVSTVESCGAASGQVSADAAGVGIGVPGNGAGWRRGVGSGVETVIGAAGAGVVTGTDAGGRGAAGATARGGNGATGAPSVPGGEVPGAGMTTYPSVIVPDPSGG
jgi:hypothetical protein